MTDNIQEGGLAPSQLKAIEKEAAEKYPYLDPEAMNPYDSGQECARKAHIEAARQYHVDLEKVIGEAWDASRAWHLIEYFPLRPTPEKAPLSKQDYINEKMKEYAK